MHHTGELYTNVQLILLSGKLALTSTDRLLVRDDSDH